MHLTTYIYIYVYLAILINDFKNLRAADRILNEKRL
jgi:hypothetical protein